MGRQKAVIKARREAKRVIRRDSRSHRQREEESVTSLVQMGGVESIGMARDSRDTSVIQARTEAQGHYLSAIESKQLIFATGEAGCGKTYISAAKAAEALIHKEVDRIIVTRPVLQADEDLVFCPVISLRNLRLISARCMTSYCVAWARHLCNIACDLKSVKWRLRLSPICAGVPLKMRW
ncbi:putative phosphate starvation-inducible protein [Yersinia pestis D182038]|nr:putative phosphate starvation-inducible protein [Yersinia pestis D182038]